MSNIWANELVYSIGKIVDLKKIKGLKVYTVKSLSPLILTFDGVDIGNSLGDTIYLHPLSVFPLINQNEEDIFQIQNFSSSTAYESPEFSALISGSFPDFLKEFYLFYKNWLSIYILNVNDSVAVSELGENKYIILQKVIRHTD